MKGNQKLSSLRDLSYPYDCQSNNSTEVQTVMSIQSQQPGFWDSPPGIMPKEYKNKMANSNLQSGDSFFD